MWQFDYQSDLLCKQVKDSLLNCFPMDCYKVKKRNVKLRQSIKITPSIWVINKNQIYIAQTLCEHVDEKWVDFKKDFINSFKESESEIIVTECGILNWLSNEK